MTWLKGQTTQANLITKLTALLAGEVADDIGNTAAVGDQWVRPIVGQDFLVTPAAQKVALGNMNHRAGYFTPPCDRAANATTAAGTFVKQTSIWSGNPGAATRWVVTFSCTNTNSVAGNYSTALITYNIYNADTMANILGPSNLNPSASGTFTLNAGGITANFTVGNTETGIITSLGTGVCWTRYYSTTYKGGYDYWPMIHRQQPTETAVFSVAPTGVAGTDWDQGVIEPMGLVSNASIIWGTNQMPLGGQGQGLGIKTNTGLSGDLYTVSWNVFPMSIRLVQNGNAILSAHLHGWTALHALDSVWRRHHGRLVSSFLRPFTTAGSVLTTSAIQYWISVKADRILIVLNGDPGQTGKLTCAGIWKFTPNSTSDVFPWAHTGEILDYTADLANWANAASLSPCRMWGMRDQREAAANANMPATRDYMTAWMNPYYGQFSYAATTFNGVNVSGQGPTQLLQRNPGNWTPSDFTMLNAGTIGVDDGNSGTPFPDVIPPVETKPHPDDGYWWLYGHQYIDSNFNVAAPGTIEDMNHYRGKLDAGVFVIPGSGWSSGDELTDTATSKVYFLVAADYAGQGMGRKRINTNLYAGGVAIEEA